MKKIKLLKSLDRIIGRPLAAVMPRPRGIGPVLSTPGKVLFIRPGGIGDAVLLIPAINKLRELSPDTKIDVLCEKRNSSIFDIIGTIHNVFRYDSISEFFGCLRAEYDIIIDTEQWYALSALTSYFIRSAFKIGFKTNSRKKLFTHSISYFHEDHETLSFMNLLAPLFPSTDNYAVTSPFLDPADIPENTGLPGKYIIFAAGTTVKEKMWDPEKFGRAAFMLSKEGINIVLVGANTDKRINSKIKEIEPSCIDLTGKTSLIELTSILKKGSLVLSPDSGIMHLASALGTPAIVLFGPSNEKKWSPLSENIIIKKTVSCSPCSTFGNTPSCRNNIECLDSIKVDEVISAVKDMLRRNV